MGSGHRVLKALVALATGQGLSVASNILLVPLFLWSLGQEHYGAWLALTSAASYLATLDFGFQMYIVNRLTQLWTANEMDTFYRVQATALVFYLILAVGGLALAGVFVSVVDIRHVVGITSIARTDATQAFLFTAASVLVNIPGGFIGAYFRSRGDLSKSQWLINLQRITVLLSTAVGLKLKVSLPTLSVILAIPPLVTSIALFAWIRFEDRRAFLFSSCNFGVLTGSIWPSLLFGQTMIAGALTVQGSLIVVSRLFGSATVVTFTVCRTLANLTRQVIGLIATASWTEITKIEAKQEKTHLALTLRLLVAVTSCVTSGATVAIFSFGQKILLVWTRTAHPGAQPILGSFLLLITLGAPWLAASMIPAATNKHGVLARAYLGSGVIGVGSGWLLAQRLGPAGMPIGLLLGEVAFAYVPVIRAACEIAGITPSTFLMRVGACAGTSLGLGVLVSLTTKAAGRGDIVPWPILLFISAGVQASISGWLYYRFLLTASDRKTLAVLLRAFISRLRAGVWRR